MVLRSCPVRSYQVAKMTAAFVLTTPVELISAHLRFSGD